MALQVYMSELVEIHYSWLRNLTHHGLWDWDKVPQHPQLLAITATLCGAPCSRAFHWGDSKAPNQSTNTRNPTNSTWMVECGFQLSLLCVHALKWSNAKRGSRMFTITSFPSPFNHSMTQIYHPVQSLSTFKWMTNDEETWRTYPRLSKRHEAIVFAFDEMLLNVFAAKLQEVTPHSFTSSSETIKRTSATSGAGDAMWILACSWLTTTKVTKGHTLSYTYINCHGCGLVKCSKPQKKMPVVTCFSSGVVDDAFRVFPLHFQVKFRSLLPICIYLGVAQLLDSKSWQLRVQRTTVWINGNPTCNLCDWGLRNWCLRILPNHTEGFEIPYPNFGAGARSALQQSGSTSPPGNAQKKSQRCSPGPKETSSGAELWWHVSNSSFILHEIPMTLLRHYYEHGFCCHYRESSNNYCNIRYCNNGGQTHRHLQSPTHAKTLALGQRLSLWILDDLGWFFLYRNDSEWWWKTVKNHEKPTSTASTRSHWLHRLHWHRSCLDSMFSAGQAPPQLGLSATGWKFQGLQAIAQLLRLRLLFFCNKPGLCWLTHFDMQIICSLKCRCVIIHISSYYNTIYAVDKL